MAGRGEELAKKFEAKVQEATAVFEKLSDADWGKKTGDWSVAVTAHHIASSHAGLSGVVKMLRAGQGPVHRQFTVTNTGNAKHAQEFANCTKAETIALHKKNAAEAAAIVRGSATRARQQGRGAAGMPPMSAGDLAGGLMVSHIDEHLNSIRAAVGH